MPLQRFTFRPGIVKELTNYANEGGWYDADKIRFRAGLPEKIGGWQLHDNNNVSFRGYCRCLHYWVTLDDKTYLAVGTNLKLYIYYAGTYNDITPIRATTSLAADPLHSTNGSSTITVTDTAHGADTGDFVTLSGATAFNNISADAINTEHQISNVTTNTYDITVTDTANATGDGGGASITAEYEIHVGNESDSSAPGWGAGAWGAGPWGGPAPVPVAGPRLRIWFADNFGEDLLSNIMDGPIYFWDATAGLSVHAVDLTTLGSDIPTVARQIIVSETDRHAFALGANPIGSATQDKLLIRWSSAEDITDWVPTASNTAGDYRLSQGSEIICGLRTRQEILVWTDVSLHSVQFLGPPYTFGVMLVAEKTTLAGPKAVAALGDVVYWMGQENFFVYDGRVRPLVCTVLDYVFSDINLAQYYKVYAGTCAEFNEVWWFYPSSSSEEPDRYVVYNTLDQNWSVGTMSRSAWLDHGVQLYPVAAIPGDTAYLYDHEFGTDNGETNPPTAINAYVESSYFDLNDQSGNGDHVMFIRRLLPDITFRNSNGTPSQVTFTLKKQYNPGSPTSTAGSKSVTLSTTTQGAYTDQLYIRMRSRQVALRVESDTVGTEWRLGATRFDIKPDGRRE